jgi:hypothetical protein
MLRVLEAIPDPIKLKCDVAAISTAGLAFFKVIPWPELAACAAFVYTLLRIAEFVVRWAKGKREE